MSHQKCHEENKVLQQKKKFHSERKSLPLKEKVSRQKKSHAERNCLALKENFSQQRNEKVKNKSD